MAESGDSNPAGASLRRGWTTGACAAAAATAAYQALLSGRFPDPVRISLPQGRSPLFPLAETRLRDGTATAGVIKDAGDDPDVTHGVLVRASVTRLPSGGGVMFRAGPGVGQVTRPGLPLPPGEPAINPAPRRMITENLATVAARYGDVSGLQVTLSIPGGAEIAARTWNPRLGILGGLSILGTTGVVIPYSCSAWIHSIHRGVDVARAAGFLHVAGATGRTSEQTVRRLYRLPPEALLDMGDFAGGLLKYLRRHPVPRLTLAGGFAKMLKLAQGRLDLHSARSRVDFEALSALVAESGGSATQVATARQANTAAQVLADCAGLPLAAAVARDARRVARAHLPGTEIAVDILLVDRQGGILAHAGWPGGLC